MSDKTQKQQQDEIEQEKVKQHVDEARKRFQALWANTVLELDLVIGARMEYNPLGIIPVIDFFIAGDKDKERAKKIKEENPQIYIAKVGGLNPQKVLGK